MKQAHTMWQKLSSRHPRWAQAVQHGIAPATLYFVAFCLLTYPLIGQFSSHYFADALDGLQNIWNLWWVNLAVGHPNLYPTIWYTNLLHWPYGSTLYAHTLTPFNTYAGVLLQRFLSLPQAYNTLTVFSFVMTGVTTYWLCHYLARSFWASLLAGFIFTFSSYHFAQAAEGHLNLISLEWLPLFILGWYILLTKPGFRIATGTAALLWLVLLCDYYYFFFGVVTAVVMLLAMMVARRSIRFVVSRDHLAPLATFLGLALFLTGPMVGTFLLSSLRDPVAGHDAAGYSLDLLGIFIPESNWRFSQWTKWYWSLTTAGSLHGGTAYVALPVLVVIAYAWFRRRSLDDNAKQQLGLWSAVIGVFFLLALGPALQVAGKTVWDTIMPYTVMVRAFPFLGVSGVPQRMTVMVIFGATILSTIGWRELFGSSPARRAVTGVLLAVLLFETIPQPLPATRIETPGYVEALKILPDEGGVVDLVTAGRSLPLYYQTIHGKPITFGYIARIPSSVSKQDSRLKKTINAGDYAKLWDTYHIRYIVTKDAISVPPDEAYIVAKLVYANDGIRIYRLGCTCEANR